MNNEQLIRRTLAEAGMELPSGPIPAKLIEDLDSTPAPAGATAAPAPPVVMKKGNHVVYTGDKKMGPQRGVITGWDGQYAMIRLEGAKTSLPFHPTWELHAAPPLDSTPATVAATAAPAPLVVGKKYKQTKGNPRVWWFDGTTTLSDSSSFPEAPARPSIHYATVDSFLAAIASGELVPADEPAADIHKELVMDTAKKMVAWGEVHVVEETTPERFDEFTGQMPSCPFCKGVHAANDCPTHGTPLSDPASVAIAAHTTPGTTDLTLAAQVAEQAMRRVAERIANDLGTNLVNVVVGNTGCVNLTTSMGGAWPSATADTLPAAIEAVRAKIAASRCKCPECGRGGV